MSIPDREYEEALCNLEKMHILPRQQANPNPSTLSLPSSSLQHLLPTKLALAATFRTGFRQALTGGGTTDSFGVPAEADEKRQPVGVEMLDAYALERWETILHYMVSSGTGQSPTKPSAGALYLLKQSGLMTDREHGEPIITSAGFQFLLQSPHKQLWELLLQYLALADKRKMNIVEVLGFFFMLSTMVLGREYSTEKLTATQKTMLEDLRDYGIVWQRRPNSKRFSPTRLATTLTSSSPPLPTATGSSTSDPQDGFIVLETNYRLYAYTDNPLQTAVLNLFVTMKYRFPNLVVGSITRESVRRALVNGISADQIISYLITHAHPQMRKSNPMIPVTVQDQIRLWELERNRLRSDEGYLYNDFSAQVDYELVVNHARKLGVVLWENSARKAFFASVDGHESIKNFIQQKVQERAS